MLGGVLICIFSLMFPFIKLVSLAVIWFLPRHNRCIEIYLNVLNQIGRYSLMDVDVAVALVIIAYDQGFRLVTNVFPGLPVYVIAIALNMFCSEAMINMKRLPDAIYQSSIKISPCWRSVQMSGGAAGVMPCVYKVVVPILWVCCVVLMWGSWKAPYIGIDMYPVLKLRNYSIIGGDAKIAPPKNVTASFEESSYDEFGRPIPAFKIPHQGGVIWTLWEDNMIFFAFIEAGFLVIFPCLKYAFMLIVWFLPMKPNTFVNCVRVQRFIGKWAMLDVFVLGTTLFIHEAGQFITMKPMAGLKWMWILLFVNHALDIFFGLATNSTIANVKQMAYIIDNNNAAFTDSHKASMLYDGDLIPEVTRLTDKENVDLMESSHEAPLNITTMTSKESGSSIEFR